MSDNFIVNLKFINKRPQGWKELADSAKQIQNYYGDTLNEVASMVVKITEDVVNTSNPALLLQYLDQIKTFSKCQTHAERVYWGATAKAKQEAAHGTQTRFANDREIAEAVKTADKQGESIVSFLRCAAGLTFARQTSLTDAQHDKHKRTLEDILLIETLKLKEQGVTEAVLLGLAKERDRAVPESVVKTIRTAHQGFRLNFGS